jgi:hypothetical protein
MAGDGTRDGIGIATRDGIGIATGDGTRDGIAAAAAAAAPVFRFTLHLPVLPQMQSSLFSQSVFSFIMEHWLPPNISLIDLNWLYNASIFVF